LVKGQDFKLFPYWQFKGSCSFSLESAVPQLPHSKEHALMRPNTTLHQLCLHI